MLSGLSDAQRTAVTSDASRPLQILAGPGSGKTRVLTTRVAWLVQGAPDRKPIPPSRCVVVTFTNKAAAEMRSRLQVLIGEERTRMLILGTFHATCARFLRRWGERIGLSRQFTIVDADDAKRIIKDICAEFDADMASDDVRVKPETAIATISRAKSRCMNAVQWRSMSKYPPGTAMHKEHTYVCRIYAEYESRLASHNALDFDDLLMYGVKLFREHPSLSFDHIEHVLVDEFQDTNAVQYELMCHMSAGNKCVSIVGDPDQSIYSWRHADVSHLERMRTDFPGVQRVLLEQNFRSTPSILDAALSVMQQDKLRIQKGLYTSHAQGAPVVLRAFHDADEEARYIALEILRHVQCTGGLLTFADISILLRFNAQSRPLEAALQRHGIPYRILGGLRFFDRAEIKDLLAYLVVTENPAYTPGVLRILNVPKRGIGTKSVQALLAAAQAEQVPLLTYLERVSPAAAYGMRPAVVKSVSQFIQTIHELRNAAENGTSVADLLHLVLKLTRYEEHLRPDPDFDSRWENVQELVSFASSIDLPPQSPPSHRGELVRKRARLSENRPEDANEFSVHNIVDNVHADEEVATTPLSAFLESSALASDLGVQEGSPPAMVTISTCHAAKGLEWPVVFLPASEDGIYPFYRSTTPEERREERRLYYVAMTRAQTNLILSWSHRRLVMSEWSSRQLSPFLAPLVSKAHGGHVPLDKKPMSDESWSHVSPPFTHAWLGVTASILSRSPITLERLNELAEAFATSPTGQQYRRISAQIPSGSPSAAWPSTLPRTDSFTNAEVRKWPRLGTSTSREVNARPVSSARSLTPKPAGQGFVSSLHTLHSTSSSLGTSFRSPTLGSSTSAEPHSLRVGSKRPRTLGVARRPRTTQ